jgi:hypothetical protein
MTLLEEKVKENLYDISQGIAWVVVARVKRRTGRPAWSLSVRTKRTTGCGQKA